MKRYDFHGLPEQEAVTEQKPTVYVADDLGKVVTIANVLVSTVLIAAMYSDSHSATVATVAGVAFFSLSTSLTLLTLSGSLTSMVTNGQNQRTTRRLHQLQHGARIQQLERVGATDYPRLPYTNPVQETMQLPENTRFVPPHAEVDEGIHREALLWLASLYSADGTPDPKKVLMQSDKERPGRVRIAAPSRPAKQYLLDKHILLDLGGTGFRLNLIRVPTIELAQQQLT